MASTRLNHRSGLYPEADGLRQGTFDTPDGPQTKSSPRFGIHEGRAAAYGGQFFISVFRNQRLASSNGTEWFWVSEPIRSTVMAVHDGLLYTSSFTWFLSDNDELWMTGFRDGGTIGPVVERGIYRWDDSLGRVSITIGTPLEGVSTGELLARGDG